MAVEVLLPKLGLTMQEGTIDEWLVAPGAAVSKGEPLLRIATDKVDVDVEAEAGGLLHPVAAAGATLPIGALIGWLLAEGEQPPGPGAAPLPAGTAGQPTGQVSAAAPAGPAGPGTTALGRLIASPNARRVAAGHGIDLSAVPGTGPGGRIVSEDVEEHMAALAAAAAVAAAAEELPASPGPDGTAGGRSSGQAAVPPARTGATAPGAAPEADTQAPVSPLVRRLARERGIDLAQVNGTGPGGRVRRADIDTAPVSPAAARTRRAPQAAAPQAGDVLPLTGMRGTIARRMHASLQEMAQLTHGYEVRMDAVVALRGQLKQEWADSGLTVPSLNDFLLKAAALALRDHPLLNATVREDGVHLLGEIHIGFAVAVPGGLLVPVLRDTDGLRLPELARESRALAGAAREGRISPDQLEGSTFTVTSLGGYGVDFFTPVVNPGNVAILGLGRLRDGVEWVDDQPRRTQVLTLSLTFDHRAVDGAPAADYLRTVEALLRRPLALLAG